MFTLLENKNDIAEAQRALEFTIRKQFEHRVVRDIGYPGGRVANARIFTDGTYWHRSADHDDPDVKKHRRLNWFGVVKPKGILHISVEINTAYEGRRDSVAGFFGRHIQTGKTYLFHSGRVAGGRAGVGKQAFLAWRAVELSPVVDIRGDARLGVLIMPTTGADALQPMLRYIDAVNAFKRAVKAGVMDSAEFDRRKSKFGSYYSEATGQRRRKGVAAVDYVSRHGEVVEALRQWRGNQPNPRRAQPTKEVAIDFGMQVDDELVELYEVKTSTSRFDMYCAIGQLLVHGTGSVCLRTVVVPDSESLAADLRAALVRLRIGVLKFRLGTTSATILGS